MLFLVSLPQALGSGDSPTFNLVKAGNGTAAAPSYSFAADPDTGIFSPSANALGLSNGGAESLFIDVAGGATRLTERTNNARIRLLQSGGLGFDANGTNQSLTFTPSGTGENILTSAYNILYTAFGEGGLAARNTLNTVGVSVASFAATGAATDSLVNIVNAALNVPGIQATRWLTGVTAPLALNPNGGNVLINSATNGTGALQFQAGAADKTSGIGFSADTFIFRAAAGEARVDTTQGGVVLALAVSGVRKAYLYYDGTNTNFIGTGSLILQSNNGTTALTLDASQTATFATLTQNYGGAAAAANTRTGFQKAVTAIANATATTVLTATIPNAAHAARIRITLVGSLGAGGTIGANEATQTISYDVTITRTAGVNAVATISTAFGSAAAAVAGATTITVAGTLAAVTGAVGATNTVPIQITITRGGGASANHTCQVFAEILNANATGITVA